MSIFSDNIPAYPVSGALPNDHGDRTHEATRAASTNKLSLPESGVTEPLSRRIEHISSYKPVFTLELYNKTNIHHINSIENLQY